MILPSTHRVIVVTLLWSNSATAANVPDKQQIINLLESAVRAISSYEVYLEGRGEAKISLEPLSSAEPGKARAAVALSMPHPTIQRSRQVYNSGKYRVEPIPIPGQPKNVDVIVSNGEVERAYDAQRREATIRQPVLQPLGYGEFYQELYCSVLGSRSIVNVLRERSNVRVSVDSDGRRILVETDPCPKENVTGNGFGFRFLLDPDLGMLPVSIEMFNFRAGRRVLWHRLVATNFKKLADGVFVPIKARVEFFWTKDDSCFGQQQGWLETVVDVARSRWNSPVDEKEFVVALPAGVRVSDLNRGVTYTTGKADPGTNLDDLAKHAKHVLRHSPTLPDRPETHWFWWTFSGALTAATLAFLLYMRRGA